VARPRNLVSTSLAVVLATVVVIRTVIGVWGGGYRVETGVITVILVLSVHVPSHVTAAHA